MYLTAKFWQYLFWFLITIVAGEWIYSFWGKFFEKGDFSFLWVFVPLLGASLIAIYKFNKYTWVLWTSMLFTLAGVVKPFYYQGPIYPEAIQISFIFIFLLILIFSFKRYFIILPVLCSVNLFGNLIDFFYSHRVNEVFINLPLLMIIILLLFQSFLSLRFLKKKIVLSILGFIICMILAFLLTGILPDLFPSHLFYNPVSLSLYILSFIAILLLVQFTDLTRWTEKEKQFLSLNILIPFFFTFLIICKTELLPQKSGNLWGNKKPVYWGMEDYEIEEDRK